MKKNQMELVFILDRSGSMAGLEADTIGGFNSLIRKQRREGVEALVSVVLFDDRTEVVYDRVPLEQVETMTEDQYHVRGCTALLDAMGGAIRHIRHLHKHASVGEVPEKTLFVITTDGYENASRRYTAEKVRSMVEKQKEKGWEFLFLGAGIDAVKTARTYGIEEERSVQFRNDSEGIRTNFEALGEAVFEYSRPDAARVPDAWNASIQADFAARGEKEKTIRNRRYCSHGPYLE